MHHWVAAYTRIAIAIAIILHGSGSAEKDAKGSVLATIMWPVTIWVLVEGE